MLDSVRYVLALIVIVAFPPALLYWFVAHGFVEHWRKVGPARAYAVILTASVLLGIVIYLAADILLRVDFGFQPVLLPAVLATYGLAAYVEVRCRKMLSFLTLVGLPELSPATRAQPLLRTGVYGQVRHPRYLAAILGLLAVTLFANYAVLYPMFVLVVVALVTITALEERELLARFGDDYAEYQRQVPRLIPRLGDSKRRVRP